MKITAKLLNLTPNQFVNIQTSAPAQVTNSITTVSTKIGIQVVNKAGALDTDKRHRQREITKTFAYFVTSSGCLAPYWKLSTTIGIC